MLQVNITKKNPHFLILYKLYIKCVIAEAAKWGLIASDVVAGFVGQSSPNSDFPGWVQFTPGVNSSSASGDSKGQQYCSPAKAVLERGADIIIVGRGLIKSTDVLATAESYRTEGWAALTQRIANP